MSLPPHDPLLNARRTGYTRSGFGARYHAHRPKPPAALVDVLRQLAGTRRQTGVPDGAADIVTCAQSLHHTEPAGTMREIGRILRPGGVFAQSEEEQWGKDQHNVERCTAERLVGFACTIGIVLPVLDLGLSDGELGLTALRDVAERTLGPDGLPWYVSYRIRAAVK